jgi:hypothetical protein
MQGTRYVPKFYNSGQFFKVDFFIVAFLQASQSPEYVPFMKFSLHKRYFLSFILFFIKFSQKKNTQEYRHTWNMLNNREIIKFHPILKNE